MIALERRTTKHHYDKFKFKNRSAATYFNEYAFNKSTYKAVVKTYRCSIKFTFTWINIDISKYFAHLKVLQLLL